ncbi:unknown [Lactococcus phage P335]|nr:unknown [Lactococcus phage P335]
MTKLEKATQKLERIRNEQEETKKVIRLEHDHIPFGQPNINGRPDIYKKVKQQYEKSRRLFQEEEKQEQRIEMLEKVEMFKEKNDTLKDVHVIGKSGYATIGAKTSVNNLDYFKEKLEELEKLNVEAKRYNKTKPKIKYKTYGTEITKLKRKIAILEEMAKKNVNKKVSKHAQKLIDNGLVNQWKKQPIYYFVKGLKKVALELNEQGDFVMSKRYSAYSEDNQKFIKELLLDDENKN